MEAAPEVPALLLTTGAGLALLLSVGPWGAVAVAVVRVLSDLVVLGRDPSVMLLLGGVVEGVVLLFVALVLEERFVSVGPVRRLRTAIEFGLIGGLVGPAVLVLGDVAVQLLTEATRPTLAAAGTLVLAHGLGVLVVTPGARMLLTGEPLVVDRDDTSIVVGGVLAATVLVAAAVLVGGGEALVDAQVAVLPLLLVGFLAGTSAYAVAVLVTAIPVSALAALLLQAQVGVPLGSQVSWWAVAFGGLALAAEGDRRRRTTQKLAALFGHAAAPSAEVSPTGRVIQVNRAFAAMLGWRPEELVESDLLMLFATDDDGAGVESLIAGHRDEVRGQAKVRTRDGSLRMVRYSGRRLEDLGTGDALLLVQLLDMTDEERRATELQRSNEALERLGNRIGHDLKQPLAAIAGYASTLKAQRDRLDEAMVDEMLDRLDLAARRVVDQLDSMVESARVGGDAAVPVSISACVDTVAGLVDIDLREDGGTIEASSVIDEVRTDPRGLQQVLLNLVTNALKYHDESVPPKVRVSSRVRGAGVEIMVTDNGPGIPHQDLETVFEPGRRLHPGVASGRGMGLADSRRVVEDLGGWLRAEPSAAGARFVLWLPDATLGRHDAPVRVVLVDLADGGVALDGAGAPGPHATLPRIELAHDRIAVVGRARSTTEGVRLVATAAPDVVLVDRWAADGDGVTALAALAAAHPPARVVVRTVDRAPESVRTALVSGATRAVDNAADGREVADVVARVAG